VRAVSHVPQALLMVKMDTGCMGFTKVTELPLLLHRVELDPFIDPTSGDGAPLGRTRLGNGNLTTALPVELAVDPDELSVRSRQAELAA
jgi:hypothetical protein